VPQAEFNPAEELKAISQLPHEERRQALETWREQYKRQRVALADMQVEMFKLVKSDNNIGLDKLLSILEQYYLKYNFTSEQNNLAKTAIELFLEEH
jgi:acyl-CoA reductase-like NAD-dependent aldehyde dehydrogenase